MIEYLFGAAFMMIAFRMLRGPTFADRMLSADTLVNIIALFIVYYSLMNNPTYIDIAIVIMILSFLGTIAVARYVIK
jgi:multisubunit Na+/H+ antiporter MnhF subunit